MAVPVTEEEKRLAEQDTANTEVITTTFGNVGGVITDASRPPPFRECLANKQTC